MYELNHSRAALALASGSGYPPRNGVTLSLSRADSGSSCRIAARPAIDSLTFCIKGASWEAVKNH
jgi:hypothetical protein